MSPPTALAGVSRTLQALLAGRMAGSVPVTLLGPDEPSEPKRVNLFLHRVDVHPQMRNPDPTVRSGTDTIVAPPLSLVATYLMTAYAATDDLSGDADAHGLLGDAMRVFHQYPVVPHDLLDPLIADAGERLRVVPRPVDLDELSRLWSTFEQPFRPSAQYDVSVVQLDQVPGRDEVAPTVPPRVRTTVVRPPAAGFRPPRLGDLSPVSGPAPRRVVVAGTHLAGLEATVRFDGQEVPGVRTDDYGIGCTLPAAAPGFHEVRVDVGDAARQVYVVEVVTEP